MLKGLLKGHSLLKDRSKKKKLTSGNVLEKVALLERKIAPALKYGVCYADTYPVLEPVGVPSTFINKTYLAHENLMKEETQKLVATILLGAAPSERSCSCPRCAKP